MSQTAASPLATAINGTPAVNFRTATELDIAKASPHRRKLLEILRGKWVSVDELKQLTGTLHPNRRVVELQGLGFNIGRRVEGGKVQFSYNGLIKA